MPGKTYSAGTIFLQVVPVFGDVQSKIKRQVQGIDAALGDELEKSGEKAGRRMGDGIEKGAKGSGGRAAENYAGEFQTKLKSALAGIDKELKPINMRLESNDLRRQLTEVKKEIESLSDAKIGVDLKSEAAYRKLVELEAVLEGIKADAKSIEFKTNVDAALAHARSAVQRFQRTLPDVVIQARLDDKMFDRSMGAFERRVKESAKRAAESFGRPLNQEMAQIKAELESFGDLNIGVDISSEEALRKLEELRIRADRVSASSIDIQAKVDTGRAQAELAKLITECRIASGQDINIKADMQTGGFMAKLAALKAAMLGAGGESASNSFRSFNALILAAVALIPALIPILGALGGAFLALGPAIAGVGAGLGAMIIGFTGIGAAVTALGQKAKLGAKDTAAAAKTMKTAAYAVTDAEQALADAQRASGQAAKASAQAVADAERSKARAVADANRAVADAERNAARSAADSARAVAAARRSAADAVKQALAQQKQAQDQYTQSVQNVKDAEQALRDARKQAKADQQNTGNQIADNALAIRQAQLNAFDATNTLNAVMADGASTAYDKAQAQLGYDQAQQALVELRQQQQQLADDKKKQDKQGINGSDAVQSAQDALTQAIKDQQTAEENLAKADKAITKARIEGQRQIDAAIRAQRRAAVDAQRAIADAVRNRNQAEADGNRAIARAKAAQDQQAQQSAEAVAKAQEQLRRAQEAYQTALTTTGDIGSSAMVNLRDAMSKLSPAGRRFARFIFGLKEQFYGLRGAIQEALLPPVQHAIKSLIAKYGPQFQGFMVKMARVSGHFLDGISKALQGPIFERFFRVMDRLAPKMSRIFGKTTINWLKIFASLMTAAAPFSLQFAKAMERGSRALSKWLASKKGQDAITHFMEYAARVGPDVVRFLGDFIKAAVNLGKALAPWGDTVLKVLDGFLRFIAKIPTKDLGLLATTILGLFLAFQAGVGAVSLFLGGAALIANPIGLIIAAVVALVVILTALYVRFAAVRKVMDFLWKVLKINIKIMWIYWTLGFRIIKFLIELIAHNKTVRSVLSKVWADLKAGAEVYFGAIKDAIGWIIQAAKDVWAWLQPIFKAIGGIFVWLWEKAVKPSLHFIGRLFSAIFHAMKKVWDAVLFPVLDLMFHLVKALWTKVFRPSLNFIGKHWKSIFTAMKVLYDTIIAPVFDALKTIVNFLWDNVFKPVLHKIGAAWDKEMNGLKTIYDTVIAPVINAFIDLMGGKKGLQSKFETVVGAISTLWSGLKKVFAAPIKFVLQTVLNDGLIAGFNKVADFVGSKEIKPIPIPKAIDQAYARGGVLPGYTPGRDVHTFVSPTAGRLRLSGGEAIMRPEWTAAVGPGFVEQMNAAARSGGVRGVRRALGGQAFASGGVYNPDTPVYINGKAISRIAAAQVALMKKLFGLDPYLMQGGYGGDHIAASGSSHNYPGVGDWGPGSIALETAMRRVGFAAWARNIPGRLQVGSGAHVHAVSLLDPMDASSPQVYGSWANHGNGLYGANNDPAPHPSWIPNLAKKIASVGISDIASLGSGGGGGGGGFHLPHFPGWIVDIAKDPIGYVKGLVSKPIDSLKNRFGDNQMVQDIVGFPGKLLGGAVHKIVDMLPGPVKSLAGTLEGVGHSIGHAVGGALDTIGLKDGGILPYNGTMKYDAGGYLPPGLTSVVNLTGKPEPVFTADQFGKLGSTGKAGITYAPTFNQSDLTSEDVVDDLEFAFRKLSRTGGGRYEGARP